MTTLHCSLIHSHIFLVMLHWKHVCQWNDNSKTRTNSTVPYNFDRGVVWLYLDIAVIVREFSQLPFQLHVGFLQFFDCIFLLKTQNFMKGPWRYQHDFRPIVTRRVLETMKIHITVFLEDFCPLSCRSFFTHLARNVTTDSTSVDVCECFTANF